MVTVFLTCILITDPDGSWWARAFPRELAMYRLEHDHNYFDFGGCGYAPAQSWQLLRDQPNAAELFDSVATHADSAAGLVMAIAGLTTVSARRAWDLSLTTRANAVMHRQPIRIIRGYQPDFRVDTVSLAQMLSPRMLDSVIALLERDLDNAPEC